MEIYSLKTDGGDTVAMCPFCGDTTGFCSIEEDDYVAPRPMLWCWVTNCDGHAVLLEEQAEKIAFTDLPEPLQKLATPRHEAYKTPLAKIVKIVNYQFYSYVKKPDSAMTLSDLREMIELVPDLYKLPLVQPEEFTTFLNKWGIEERVGVNDEGEPDKTYEWNAWDVTRGDTIDYTLHLPVNSYNIAALEQPYPKNFDTSHDGIYVYLQCLDAEGNPFDMMYWGD